MAEPRLLQVGNEETIAKEKGESGLSSAQVGTEAKTVEKASEEPKGVYVANENVVSDNSKALRTSKEAPKGQYVAPTERLGGFERSAGEKGVVNTITVDEVKALIKQYGGSGDTYTKEEIDHIVETMRKGLYQEVDTTEYPTLEDFLDSDGEEGIIYLYPVGNEGNNYYQYIWETTKEWISLGTTVVDLSQYAKLTLLAPIYNSTATYSVGAKCIYNGKLYTCSTAITQAEDFDATHWTEITVASGFVDLDSEQTISGRKIFTANLCFGNTNNYIRLASNALKFAVASSYRWNISANALLPNTTNVYDIGGSGALVKDLYLSGKIKDGTNEFNADNVFNVINASDISVSGSVATLTEAQLAIIDNGRPTIIKGTLLGHTDIKIININGAGTNSRRIGTYFQASRIGVNQKILAITMPNRQLMLDVWDFYIDFTSAGITLRGLNAINYKTFPAYPTTNTSPQYLQIDANGGNLSYNDPFTPTSVSLSDGDAISDTTLQANIQYHRPIVLNGFTCYFSCDDGTNYQYTSMRYDANANKNHINVITINKSTWIATFHTSDLTLN